MQGCVPCSVAGVVCDGAEPCGQCTRFGLAHNCFRTPRPRGRPRTRVRAPAAGTARTMVDIKPRAQSESTHTPHTTAVAPAPLPSISTSQEGPTTLFYTPAEVAFAPPPPATSQRSSPSFPTLPATTTSSPSSSSSSSPSLTPSSPAPYSPFAVHQLMEDANWSINTAVASTSSVDLFLMNRIGQIQNTVEQLAKENTRLKKRQRESDSLMLELQRSQLMPGLDSSKLRITMPQAHLGGRVAFRGGDRSSSENTMLELWWCFPFLKDYDMTRRPFVATDLRKPVWVLNMDNSCVPFANPHFCDMMGYSLYELCENKSVASMNTADRLKFRLLMNNYREPFGVSDIMAFEMEFMDKQGNMIKLAIQCQIFFKDDAQARYSVMCADQVLGSRPPPWAMLEALGLPQQELTPEEERQRMSLYRQQTYRREKQEWNDLSQVLGLGPPWAPWPCVPPAIEQLPQQPQALVAIQQLPSFVTERVGQEGEDREDHQLFSPAPTSPFSFLSPVHKEF